MEDEDEGGMGVVVIDGATLVSMGLIPGFSIVDKFGRNNKVNGPADVWMVGGDYTGQPETGPAETIEVLSTSDDDSIGGTGAHTVEVFGLADDFSEQSEVVSVTGTTPVVTVGLWRRCFRMIVRSAGSGRTNAGDITARHSTTHANVFGAIIAGLGQTQIAAYTVPAGKTGYIKRLFRNITREEGGALNREATVVLFVRPPGQIYQAKFNENLNESGSMDQTLYGSIEVTEKSDVKWRVISVSRGSTDVAAGFEMLLMDQP